MCRRRRCGGATCSARVAPGDTVTLRTHAPREAAARARLRPIPHVIRCAHDCSAPARTLAPTFLGLLDVHRHCFRQRRRRPRTDLVRVRPRHVPSRATCCCAPRASLDRQGGGGRRQLGGACERPAAGIRSGAGCGARRPARWTHTSASRARTESSTTSAAPSPLERSVLCRWAEPRARAASPRGARGVLLACSRGEAASGVLHRRPARRRRAASAGRGGAAVWRPGLYSPRSHVERVQQVAAGEAPAREGGREGDRDRERERERRLRGRQVGGAWAQPCPPLPRHVGHTARGRWQAAAWSRQTLLERASP